MKHIDWYRVLRPGAHKLMNFLYRPTIEKEEEIPKDEKIILAGNHIHLLDAVLLTMATDRHVYVLAKRELFTGPKRIFFEKMGCIPVDRSGHGLESIRDTLLALNDNKCIGIFPEGTRNQSDDIILPFKLGTVVIAKRGKSDIIPFAITGKYKLFRNDLHLSIGKRIKTSDYKTSELLDKVQDDVKYLIKKRYGA